jgi:hypothetical protein
VNHVNDISDSSGGSRDELDASEHNSGSERILIKTTRSHKNCTKIRRSKHKKITPSLSSDQKSISSNTTNETPRPESLRSELSLIKIDARGDKSRSGSYGTTSTDRSKVSCDSVDSSVHSVSSYSSTSTVSTTFATPDWEPLQPFSFPVYKMPILAHIPLNLKLSSFTDVIALAEGSNAQIFTAKNGDNSKVIVKIMKSNVRNKDVASHEFDIEHTLLSRCDHENIVKIKGAGCNPRKFLMLENLTGGTLTEVLAKPEPTALARLFRREKDGMDLEMRSLIRAR